MMGSALSIRSISSNADHLILLPQLETQRAIGVLLDPDSCKLRTTSGVALPSSCFIRTASPTLMGSLELSRVLGELDGSTGRQSLTFASKTAPSCLMSM
jgi:hypothetical protein